MAISEKERKGKSITMLFMAFGQAGEAERMAMYVQMLHDIPADILDRVCRKAMLECKFLPSIAELVESANNLVGEAMNEFILPWDMAWKEIEREMHDTFVYGTPHFSTPEIEKAVNSFGWQELCEVTTKELPIVRAQLRDMYLSACEQSKKSKINQYVMGNGALIGGESWKMLPPKI